MGSGADLDEGGADELAVQRTGGGRIWAAAARIWAAAAAGSGWRRRPDLDGGGGRIWAAAAGSGQRRPDLGGGGRIWTAAAEKTATAAKGTATAAGRRDGGWKKKSKKP